MALRRFRHVLVPLLAALALPGSASAQTGGAAAPTKGSGVAAASDGSFSLSARAGTLLGRTVRFRGTVPDAHAGRTVTIERLDPLSAQWMPAVSTTVAGDGAFVARWRSDQAGLLRVRARVEQAGAGGARAAAASPEIAVTVYKPATATWYGPGFYGRRTACGQKMTRSLLGVAHKKLPCGTRVAILYKGASIVVPVVDRGPFRKNTAWDLTIATARAVGFTHTDRIGAVRVRGGAANRAR